MSHKRAFEFFGGVLQLVLPGLLEECGQRGAQYRPGSQSHLPDAGRSLRHGDHARQAAQTER